MRMRRLWLVLGFLLAPTLVHADDHRMRAFGAMSQAYASILAGFYGSVDVSTPFREHDLGWLGEFGLTTGSHEDVDETNITFLTGPTIALYPRRGKPFVFTGHLLLGIVNTDSDADSRDHTGFGLGFGGAWDYSPGRAPDPHKNGFGARVQVDWVWAEGAATNFLRASVGATYTWYPKTP